MSNNPFEKQPEKPVKPDDFATPVEATTPYSSAEMTSLPAKKKLPGAMMAIAIICLILGILGLSSSCMSGVFLAAQPALENMIENIPDDMPDAEETKEISRMGFRAQDSMFIPSIVLTIIGLIVALMLIVGSIGALRGKLSGRDTLNLALLAAIFYSFLKIGIGVYAQIASTAFINDAIENYQGDANKERLQEMMAQNSLQSLIGPAIIIGLGVGLLIFYIWAKLYIKSEKVTAHYEGT